MSFWSIPPEPKSKLGRYRILSANAGIRVSPLCLGAMSIGDSERWASGMGAMNKESSFNLLDAYFDAGGNFIDTANNYQDETSEEVIGEWAEKRGIRDQLVIATKYSCSYKQGKDDIVVKINHAGNSHKSMHMSVEASLKKLRTSYIDILYVHWWDWETSMEEIMNSLHNLVAQGKVLYLGISDTPAWIVSKANQWARDHAKTPFCIYQGMWSILDRSFEREIIPMAKAEGLALAPWGVVGGGKIRTDEEEQNREKTGEKGREFFISEWKRTPKEVNISRKLGEIAKQLGVKHVTAVAIAYVLHKAPHVFPIIGGRKIEHLHANIEALSIRMTPEQIKDLEAVEPFNLGFPLDFIGDGTFPSTWMKDAGHVSKWPGIPAIPKEIKWGDESLPSW